MIVTYRPSLLTLTLSYGVIRTLIRCFSLFLMLRTDPSRHAAPLALPLTMFCVANIITCSEFDTVPPSSIAPLGHSCVVSRFFDLMFLRADPSRHAAPVGWSEGGQARGGPARRLRRQPHRRDRVVHPVHLLHHLGG